MCGEHHPFVGLAGIVVDQGLGLGRSFLGLDRHRGRGPARGTARKTRGRLRRNAEGGDAIATFATRRACHDMARQGSRDKEAHRAVGARHVVLAAAVDGAGGEHQLVPHQDDAAPDLGRVRLELVGRAAA